ncbi:glutathione S-transferase N-terminal domain-containing protein [archaeon]|nr:glutathione S-transferase N-terminal domain-containing protein [archaeon]
MKQQTVKLYTTQTCPHCLDAKLFLKQNSIKFEEIDIGKDKNAARTIMQKTGMMAVPVIQINEKFIVGFDRKAIGKELGL